MQIKVDEDLPPVAAEWLRAKGHEASTVVEQVMGGWKDAPLWEAIQAKGQFLITADKGFADIRIYAPGTHAGVLLLRPEEDGIWPILTLLAEALSTVELAELQGMVAVATPRGLRVRRS